MTDEDWLLKEKYNGEKTEGFFADLTRLKNGEPLAYLIGHIPFLDTNIFLDSHPLIPRTETEFWVEKALHEIVARGKTSGKIKVLDLCAGSGCIGVAVLKMEPLTWVDFVEIDMCHHKTIQKNIVENGIDSSRSHIVGGDLFENVSETYDFILSNPPYIDAKSGRTESSVLDYEPHSALFGGKSGMELIEKIITAAPQYLAPNGILYIEHEPEQRDQIHTIAHTNDLIAETYTDQYDVFRYTRFTRKNDHIVAS